MANRKERHHQSKRDNAERMNIRRRKKEEEGTTEHKRSGTKHKCNSNKQQRLKHSLALVSLLSCLPLAEEKENIRDQQESWQKKNAKYTGREGKAMKRTSMRGWIWRGRQAVTLNGHVAPSLSFPLCLLCSRGSFFPSRWILHQSRTWRAPARTDIPIAWVTKVPLGNPVRKTMEIGKQLKQQWMQDQVNEGTCRSTSVHTHRIILYPLMKKQQKRRNHKKKCKKMARHCQREEINTIWKSGWKDDRKQVEKKQMKPWCNYCRDQAQQIAWSSIEQEKPEGEEKKTG